jgi:hypothetical protein
VPIPTATKSRFIDLLAGAGLREIAATSFVAPRAIPQLADADALFTGLVRVPGVRYPVLVPNVRGLERAEAAGVDAIAVFTATTDAFTTANIGMTVAGSLTAFEPVLARAAKLGWWRRGYVSTAFVQSAQPARAVESPAISRHWSTPGLLRGTRSASASAWSGRSDGRRVADPRRSAASTSTTLGTASTCSTGWLRRPLLRQLSGGTGLPVAPGRPATSPPRTWFLSTPRARPRR